MPPFQLASLPGLGPPLMTLQRPSTNAERTLRAVGERPDGLDELRDVLVATQRLPAYTPSLLALRRSLMSRTRPRPQIVTSANQLRHVQHPVRLIWAERDTVGNVGAGQRIKGEQPQPDLLAAGTVPPALDCLSPQVGGGATDGEAPGPSGLGVGGQPDQEDHLISAGPSVMDSSTLSVQPRAQRPIRPWISQVCSGRSSLGRSTVFTACAFGPTEAVSRAVRHWSRG